MQIGGLYNIKIYNSYDEVIYLLIIEDISKIMMKIIIKEIIIKKKEIVIKK